MQNVTKPECVGNISFWPTDSANIHFKTKLRSCHRTSNYIYIHHHHSHVLHTHTRADTSCFVCIVVIVIVKTSIYTDSYLRFLLVFWLTINLSVTPLPVCVCVCVFLSFHLTCDNIVSVDVRCCVAISERSVCV